MPALACVLLIGTSTNLDLSCDWTGVGFGGGAPTAGWQIQPVEGTNDAPGDGKTCVAGYLGISTGPLGLGSPAAVTLVSSTPPTPWTGDVCAAPMSAATAASAASDDTDLDARVWFLMRILSPFHVVRS